MAETDDKEPEDIIQQQEVNHTLPLRAALSNIFKNIAESVSEETFAECLSNLQLQPKVVQKLYNAFIKDFSEIIHERLDEMLSEGLLSNGLGKLKDLIVSSPHSPDEIAWRPPGDVIQHLRSLDIQQIFDETNRLKKELDQVEIENQQLQLLVNEKRALTKSVENRIAHAQKIGSVGLTKMGNISSRLREYMCDNND